MSIGWTSIHLRGLPTKRSKLPQLRFTHVFYVRIKPFAVNTGDWLLLITFEIESAGSGAVSTRNVSTIELCASNHCGTEGLAINTTK